MSHSADVISPPERAPAGTRALDAPSLLDLHPMRPPYVSGFLTTLVLIASMWAVISPFTPRGKFVPVPFLLSLLGAWVGDWLWTRRNIGTRARLRLSEHELHVSLPQRAVSFPFASLRSVSLQEKPFTLNGEPFGVYRVLTLRGPDGKVSLKHLTPDELDDSFGAVAEAVLAGAVRSARRQLDAGQVLHGEGWTLDARWLKTPKLQIERAQLAVHQTAPDELLLWRRGSEDSALRLSLSHPNARVLRGVLEPESWAPSPATEGPGRRLAWRMTEFISPLGFALLGGFFSGGALYALVMERPMDLAHELVCGFAFLMGLPPLGLGVQRRPSILSIHEHAVTLRQWWSATPLSIRCAEVVELQLQLVCNRYADLPLTTTTLTLVDIAGQRLVFTISRLHPDEKLRAVRDRILEQLTVSWRGRIEAGEEFPWGEEALLGRHGLRMKNLPHGPHHAFSELGLQREDGHLQVFTDKALRLFTLSASAPNFHVGLRLIQESLCASQAQRTRDDIQRR